MPWPNWRNESEYKNPPLDNREAWAWEFLRRNSKYEAEFDLAMKITEEDGKRCLIPVLDFVRQQRLDLFDGGSPR